MRQSSFSTHHQTEYPKHFQLPMGHSSINVTMDTYDQLMRAAHRETFKRLDNSASKINGDFWETFNGRRNVSSC